MAKPIYFGPAQESGSDPLSGAAPVSINTVIDGRGVVRRRPGLVAPSSRYAGVVDAGGLRGLYESEGGVLYALGDSGATYRIGPAAAVTNVGSPVYGSARPTFAETEALLVIAAGGDLQKIDLATHESSRLGGTPPEGSTHVVANALRLLANDGVTDRTKVRYSDISQGTLDYSGHESWTFGGVGVSGFFTAEARPDPVVALHENTNEVFAFGTTNLQVFAPDGASVYAPVGTKEYGCAAPYSIIKTDSDFAWLDHHRRIVMSDGRSHKVLSDKIQATLNALTTVSDCHGFRVVVGAIEVLGWTFPTDGRTFALQVGGGWSQWQGYGTSGPTSFPAVCHHHARSDNAHLVGTSSGRVAELQMGATSDLGEPLVAYAETGYLDRETSMKKWCQAVRFTLRRGETSSSSAPVALLRYSDREGQWSAPMPIHLGVSGDTESDVELRSLGVYRRRAWRFEFSGDVDLALIRAEEDFTVLDH